MSFESALKSRCQEYTNMVINGTRIQVPYMFGKKYLPAAIKKTLIATGKSGADLQTWATNNPKTVGVDCSGLVYYAINEASGNAVRSYFEKALSESNLAYPNGILAAHLTDTIHGRKITRAADMVPGCLMRSDNGKHVLVISDVSRSRIDYTHSNSSHGPHTGYITIGDPNADLAANAQVWHDIAYTDTKAKSYYNHTTLLNCLSGGAKPVNEIPVSAQLTVQGTNVSVRISPQTGAVVKTLNTGARVKATGRVLINRDPWFHITDGWISGNYVQGWVKDYNDNNRWWYLGKNYTHPASSWKTISGKDYCFGKDGYLFVECYIKSEDKNIYYWVDDDGVWLEKYNTTVPEPGYRVVKNYKKENAYRG